MTTQVEEMEADEKIELTLFRDNIGKCNATQIDTLWAILKYKEIGIYRKIKCMSEVMGIDFDEVTAELPKDDEGRILDHKSRHAVHDILLNYS